MTSIFVIRNDKLCNMESKRRKKELVLLPAYFKKIGLAIILLSFVPAVVIKSMDFKLVQIQRELFRVFTLNAFLLGLLFIAWSKDKVEDEMTFNIRLNSMAFTFAWTVLYVVFKPIVDLLFKSTIGSVTGQEVVMNMLFVYLILYYLQKLGR